MKKQKSIKKSITIPPKTVDELGRRCGTKKNALSGQVSSDMMFFHALLDLLGLEAMIDGRFSEAGVQLLLAHTNGMVLEPGRLASIAQRITATLAEHTSADNHLAMTALSSKIMKLSVSQALWLWDRLTVYRANSHRNEDREYLLALFGVK